MAARLRRRRARPPPAARGASAFQLPPRRSGDDADAAVPRDRSGGPAQAQLLGPRHLRRDRDRGRLPQGQPICGIGRRPRPHRSGACTVVAVRAARRADLLDVPHSRAQAGRPADRRARMVLRQEREICAQDRERRAAAVGGEHARMINLSFFPSRRLAFYMVRLFLTRSLAVLVALILILMTLDLLGESGKILAVPGNGDAQLWHYVALRLPLLVSRFLPFSVLLGTLIAFVGLNQHSEVVAMKAAGLSAHQILAPLVVASIGIAALLFAFNEGVVVNSARVVDAWSGNDYKPIPPVSGVVSNVWLLQGDDLLRVGIVSGRGAGMTLHD